MSQKQNCDAKEGMKKTITDYLMSQAEAIRENETTSVEDKCSQMDILLDLVKFLDNYEENVKVLNAHNQQHRFER